MEKKTGGKKKSDLDSQIWFSDSKTTKNKES